MPYQTDALSHDEKSKITFSVISINMDHLSNYFFLEKKIILQDDNVPTKMKQQS